MQTQAQACARDASVGVFIDGSGSDEYFHRNRCAGAGDLNSIALFWDRAGDDAYLCDRRSSYAKDRSYGASATYDRFRTVRDDVPTVGAFLDTGGEDSYTEVPALPLDDEALPLEFGNSRSWRHNNGRRFRGVGTDVDWFVPAPAEK